MAIEKSFKLVTDYTPKGDQPRAIRMLSEGVNQGLERQTLKGATGTGKTFVIAHLIVNTQRPTLVISHNKTLAAQLYTEFKTFFPENAVEYFVSYYDYYQPEAYVPKTDTYIAKETSINEEIDRLRHSSTQSLLSRKDVIVVASSSCLYGLGSPQEYLKIVLRLHKNQIIGRNEILKKLVDMQYERNDTALSRGRFRARGNVIEVCPINQETVLRFLLNEDKIEEILELDPITGIEKGFKESAFIFPAKHFVTPKDELATAIKSIKSELQVRLEELNAEDKLLEAQRLEQRTKYDLEMIEQIGYCSGIENYSRHFDGREEGEPPHTLLDYFPKSFLTIIDESHVTIPQLEGMYGGDTSRKETLIDHGFRLKSAKDNRPLSFKELNAKIGLVIYMSATPSSYEIKISKKIVEQIIRPTGLVDPEVIVRPEKGQVQNLINEIKNRIQKKEKCLVTTLTKKMAENLSEFLQETGINVHYLHSEIDTLDRVDILKDLRLGVYDAIIGVNLLREGLDLPEVSLVAILDADSEGFLRSGTSLIQTIGRASRNASGQVIMYADIMTGSMRRAIDETQRRRAIQLEYNRKYGIVPETIRKEVKTILAMSMQREPTNIIAQRLSAPKKKYRSRHELSAIIAGLEEEMFESARKLEFEKAAMIRDQIRILQSGEKA
ncbi:MAG: excinuclease ABC subunit UvrB [Candidatus Bathyarchaeota archaeon]|nr:excinuclease ABC subunit UvrB [Candidatus Bathyarchaeota archaeon]